MATRKLTKAVVDRLGIGDVVWDTQTRGFGARRRNKETTFVLKVTVHRRQRFFTIGRKGAPWTVKTARKDAVRLLGSIANGKDPAAERDGAAHELTVDALAKAFMARHVRAKRKSSTHDFYQHVLNAHVLPTLGKRLAIDVTKSDVATLHHDLQDTPYVANRALAVIGSMYSWASKAGFIAEGLNPVLRVEKFEEKSRERFLSLQEIDRLGGILREAETVGLLWDVDESKAKAKHAPKKENRRPKLSPYVTAAVRLLMFTGCRLREILHLEWRHVDMDRGVLFLPDSKTGKKTVVLAAPALAVLASLEKIGRYVIVGEDPDKPRVDLKRPWSQITKRAELKGLRIHDLRHTFASFGAGSNIGLPMIGKLLGHTQARTTERYAHLAVDPLRRSADLIAGTIAAAMGEAVAEC